MKYSVDKEKFIRELRSRPHLIKKVHHLDVQTACEILKAGAKGVYEYLDKISPSLHLKENVQVVKAFVYLSKEEREELKRNPNYNYSRSRINMSLIPISTFKFLTEEERVDLIERNNYDGFIDNYTNPTFKEWLTYVRKFGIDFDKIPDKYHTRRELYRAHADYLTDKHYSVNGHIPLSFWTVHTDAETFLIDLIKRSPEMFELIPSQRITNRVLIAFLQTENASLDNNHLPPDDAWDQATVRIALKVNQNNIDCIPLKYLTELDALEAVKSYVPSWGIPKSLQTKNVKAHMVAYAASSSDVEILLKENKSRDFILRVAKITSMRTLKNIANYVKEEDYIDVLKANPAFISFIPKLEQTDEIITTFLMNATPAVMDACCDDINLGKIKKDHACLLIGCEAEILKSIAERKLKGNRKTEEVKTVTGPNIIEINIAPADFVKLNENLNRHTL